jgi:cystathionine gamma-synthase
MVNVSAWIEQFQRTTLLHLRPSSCSSSLRGFILFADMELETLAVHAGHHTDPTTGAVAPPLILSTTFERDTQNNTLSEYFYSRSGNPNRTAFEEACAALEGGAVAAAFASGQAATMSVLHALSAGDHFIAPTDIYYGTRAQAETLYARWGLQASFVDMTDLAEIRQALRPHTKLIWVETPSNPRLHITDIAAVAELAHAHGAVLACDSTWSTPVITRPFEFGADLVMHSTTKYFGGHSDILGGCLVARENNEFFERIRTFQINGGAVASPFDCWLLLRSLPTLPARVEIASRNAAKLAEALSRNPRVAVVHYPGLPQHPGHAIAARQMKLFGGMLSLEIAGGREAALAVAGRVQIFKRATSLGGVESLLEHRATVEGPNTTTPDNLLRLSIGLENADDLLADLLQALD